MPATGWRGCTYGTVPMTARAIEIKLEEAALGKPKRTPYLETANKAGSR